METEDESDNSERILRQMTIQNIRTNGAMTESKR